MSAVLNQGSVKTLLSDDHFSVDGTLIEAWASMKSFRAKDGPLPTTSFGCPSLGQRKNRQNRRTNPALLSDLSNLRKNNF
jgi:hypothetical protein